MSVSTIQMLFCAIVGLFTGVVIYRTSRKGLINFRYTVGWLMLCAFGVLAGVLIPIITPIANYLAITPAALLAIVAIMLLVLISVQLSVSISGLHERQRRLTEELAHLRQSIDVMKNDLTK